MFLSFFIGAVTFGVVCLPAIWKLEESYRDSNTVSFILTIFTVLVIVFGFVFGFSNSSSQKTVSEKLNIESAEVSRSESYLNISYKDCHLNTAHKYYYDNLETKDVGLYKVKEYNYFEVPLPAGEYLKLKSESGKANDLKSNTC